MLAESCWKRSAHYDDVTPENVQAAMVVVGHVVGTAESAGQLMVENESWARN